VFTAATIGQPIVTVLVHHDEGCVWAESEQIPRWTAVAGDIDGLYRLCREGVDLEFPDSKATIIYQEQR